VSRNLVSFVAITAAIACLLGVAGLGWTLYDYVNQESAMKVEKTEPVESKKEVAEKHIVALGDSLTRGTGDAKGKGYVGNLIANLEKKSDEKLLLTNLGIKGQTSVQLASQLKQKEVQRQVEIADVVLITIGGNDLFRGGQGLMDMSPESLLPVEQQYEANLHSILKDIRSVNKEANIFLIGLYNPFIELENGVLSSKVVRDWNYKSADISSEYPKTVFVPTFDLFQMNVNDYLYTDQFHPNTEGYKLIAERVASLITF
jgi:lysophospholipase L1-like esterase